MTPELEKSVASAIDTIKNGAVDVVGQFPELADQLVKQATISACLWLAFGVACVLGSLYIWIWARRVEKKELWDTGDRAMAHTMATLVSIGALAILVLNLYSLLCCLYSPKIVALQEMINLVRR